MISPTSLTLISYAVPATLVGGLTLWVGRERSINWKIWEPVVMAVPFLMVLIYITLTFGSIHQGIMEMEFHPVAVIMIAGIGGFLGGLTLLPRLIFTGSDVPGGTVSLASGFLVGLLCLKMFFLMAAFANPKALIAPD
ncbi:hypothetical protein Ga0123461_1059 [Mariprofundus aestuarium]|uniref:Uncharacterized protein n=1 Tax=Mariprofundus aestuarium TaxID=1921086 RepID=A0A2K8KX58_MARES|nr:hypothetical protein [Mariprofundus aestuarium]ATX79478.1 hypothetical protein Ga0123461_1059 [Mariprofundus aestuarium]